MGTMHELRSPPPPPQSGVCKCGKTVVTLTSGYPGASMELGCAICHGTAKAEWPLRPAT